MSKNVKNVESVVQVFTFVHFEIANGHFHCKIITHMSSYTYNIILQESPAIADKPARRESLPKIAPIRRAYNVVADNTGLSSFV